MVILHDYMQREARLVSVFMTFETIRGLLGCIIINGIAVASAGPLRQAKRRTVTEPVAAYGPMGSNGETNVSVIASPILPGFELRNSLGSPEKAGTTLLSKVRNYTPGTWIERKSGLNYQLVSDIEFWMIGNCSSRESARQSG